MIALGYSGFTRDSRRAAQGRSLGMTSLGFDRMVRSVDGELPISLFPLGFFGHDAAAGIVVDGEVVACAAEERFTRVKHGLNVAGNPLLPRKAIQTSNPGMSAAVACPTDTQPCCEIQHCAMPGDTSLHRSRRTSPLRRNS